MAQIELRSKLDTEADWLSNLREPSDETLIRVIAAYGATYFPDGVVEREATETEAAVYRAPTGAEVFQAMTDGIIQGVMNFVEAHERQEAIKSVLVTKLKAPSASLKASSAIKTPA